MKGPILFFFLSICIAGSGQSAQKIGHIDTEFVFRRLPEYKRIEAEMKVFERQLQARIQDKAQELEGKFKEYQSLPPDTPEPIRNDKASGIEYLQENLQKFTQDAQASFQKKQNDLTGPVLQKVYDAIRAIAGEDGYTYIFDLRGNSGALILFADEAYDISKLVLQKLGVADDDVQQSATK